MDVGGNKVDLFLQQRTLIISYLNGGVMTGEVRLFIILSIVALLSAPFCLLFWVIDGFKKIFGFIFRRPVV